MIKLTYFSGGGDLFVSARHIVSITPNVELSASGNVKATMLCTSDGKEYFVSEDAASIAKQVQALL